MIEISFNINNPKPDGENVRQKDYFCVEKLLGKTWAMETQLSKMPSTKILGFHLDMTWTGRDHAGPNIRIEIFRLFFSFSIYNTRHWNWEKRRFYLAGESQYEDE